MQPSYEALSKQNMCCRCIIHAASMHVSLSITNVPPGKVILYVVYKKHTYHCANADKFCIPMPHYDIDETLPI